MRPLSRTESARDSPCDLSPPTLHKSLPNSAPLIPEHADESTDDITAVDTAVIVDYLTSLSTANPKIHQMLCQLHQMDSWQESHPKKSLLPLRNSLEFQEKRQSLLKSIQEEVQVSLTQHQQHQELPDTAEGTPTSREEMDNGKK